MIKERLQNLRDLMKTHNIAAYMIPGTDPHQSEYLPDLWKRREWISGFTGSAGELVVTQNEAGLFTDSRYFIQAEQQLKHSGIDLVRIGVPGEPSLREYLVQKLNRGEKVGVDPRLMTFNEAGTLEAYLNKRDIELVFIDENFVDNLWMDQPAVSEEKAFLLAEHYAGESIDSKFERLRKALQDEAADALVLSALDQIAWTFNMRGSDVDYNPVVIAYAILTKDDAMLFLNENKLSASDRKAIEKQAKIYPYEAFATHLKEVSAVAGQILLDAATVTRWITDLVGSSEKMIIKQSPVTMMKACKNDTELTGFRNCHVRDGVAMVRFLHWLEQAVPKGGVTEISAAQKLLQFREEQDLFQGQSFSPISAYQEHGAIVHYSATPESDVELKAEGIYLIDSGGQYLDGTTDITRTIALGKPTGEQRDRFTLVLKGHINLAMARFPVGTTGIQLDTIARKPLWDIGLNYGHGTGHGIGSFLNVHEGPQAISYYRGIGIPLKPGMICSNEPGFYKAGEYGIRIENLIEVIQDEQLQDSFYTFSTATLCPVDRNLVNKNLLTETEIDYFNTYHKRVYESLSPHLGGETKKWLSQTTEKI